MTTTKFSTKQYIKKACRNIIEANSEDRILVTVSGGVDSSTTAALIAKTGLKSQPIFIDTGFLRINESEIVTKFFKNNIKIIDKKKLFYNALKNISEPVKKREVFRQLYFKIIKEYVIKNKFSAIAQGTQFHKTKTKRYHNSPTDDFLSLNIKILEPVKGLSKQEIRLVAKQLGLPDEIINRRPFPGPGLLLRFGGRYTKEKLEIIKHVTAIVDAFLLKNKMALKDVYQIFPYLTDESATFIDSNGKGSTASIVLIRALMVEIKRGEILYKPFILPKVIQKKLVNEIMKSNMVSRVCFDMTPKYGVGENVRHGGTIEYF